MVENSRMCGAIDRQAVGSGTEQLQVVLAHIDGGTERNDAALKLRRVDRVAALREQDFDTQRACGPVIVAFRNVSYLRGRLQGCDPERFRAEHRNRAMLRRKLQCEC
jgi:hypothetical protein